MSSAVIGALRVNLGLDSAQFRNGILGATTGITKFLGPIGLATTAVGAAVAGFTAFAGKTSYAARQVANLSKLSGTNVEDFQRMTAAAKTVGFESEKVGDILKDVSDKMGDFIQTGGGPMKDFFENIAPQVGVTAEEFRKLSGKDALQLYVNSLEKANLSQSDMTFYMEAVANDATKLLPLLSDNGAELERLGDEAERTGAIMSEGSIAAGSEFSKSIDRLGTAFKGLGNALVDAGVFELLTAMVDGLILIIQNIRPVISELGQLATVGVKYTLAFFQTFISMVSKFTEKTQEIRDQVVGLVTLVKTELLDRLGAVFDSVKEKIALVAGKFRWLWDVVVGNSYVPDMVDAIMKEFGRLSGIMVRPAEQATSAVAGQFESLEQSVGKSISGINDLITSMVSGSGGSWWKQLLGAGVSSLFGQGVFGGITSNLFGAGGPVGNLLGVSQPSAATAMPVNDSWGNGSVNQTWNIQPGVTPDTVAALKREIVPEAVRLSVDAVSDTSMRGGSAQRRMR